MPEPAGPRPGESRRLTRLASSVARLGLPLASPGVAWAGALLVLLATLPSLSHDLSFYDSAELALVAVQGGLGHPIGQPLHTLLGWLFAHLPWVPPLVGLNLLSALATALSVVPLASLAEGLAGTSKPATTVGGRLPALGAMLVLVLTCLHPTLWEHASRVEVYGLALLFTLWGTARAAGLLRPGAGRAPWAWGSAGLGFGLAAAVNPYLAVIAALGLAPAIAAALLRRRLGGRELAAALAGGLLGLLPYLYVPLVAGRSDVLVWGRPLDPTSLRAYFSGADYSSNRQTSWAMVGAHLRLLAGHGLEQGLLPLLLPGLFAHLRWGARAGLGWAWALLALGLSGLLLASNTVFFADVADYQGYLALPLAGAGAGVAALVLRGFGAPGRPLRAGAAGLLLAVALTVGLAPPPLCARTRRQDEVARVLAQGALDHAPQGAILVVSSDHWVFPLLYLQQVEQRRPDVVVLASLLAGSSWQWRLLYRQHPELRPFALRGPGGAPARVGRFLAAQGERPRLFENWELGARYGRALCAGPWLLQDRAACPAVPTTLPQDPLSAAVTASLAAVGHGSPTTDAVLAAVALDRGEVFWRLGQPAAALRALRAGVPAASLPPLAGVVVDAAGSLRGPLALGPPTHSIGHRARNLILAARLLEAAGARALALAHIEADEEAVEQLQAVVGGGGPGPGR